MHGWALIQAHFTLTAPLRDGVWPVAVDAVPGPQYLPQLSSTTKSLECAVFPTEQRFVCRNTRFISKDHAREVIGRISPGPARYLGHDQVVPVVPPSSAPASSRPVQRIYGKSPRARAVTADSAAAKARQVVESLNTDLVKRIRREVISLIRSRFCEGCTFKWYLVAEISLSTPSAQTGCGDSSGDACQGI